MILYFFECSSSDRFESGRVTQEIRNALPKSQIGKSMAYAYARSDALSAYLYDGNLQIDDNLVEVAIRPRQKELPVRRQP
jgi:hypothetical protein